MCMCMSAYPYYPGFPDALVGGVCNRWFVISPETNERQFVTWHNKLFTDHIDIFDAWQKLARPDPALDTSHDLCHLQALKKKDREHFENNTSPLIFLPNELLRDICLHLSVQDILALGASCLTMLKFVCGYIDSDLAGKPAPWAGRRLALGQEDSAALPKDFTKIVCEENDEIAEKCRMWYKGEEATDDACLSRNVSFLDDPEENMLKSLAIALQKLGEQVEVDALAVSALRDAILRPGLKNSSKSLCYLRNLSKGEFIECKSNPVTFGGTVRTWDPTMPLLRLDSVLCMLLQYSTQRRGRWAGDTFDIVTQRMHKAELEAVEEGSGDGIMLWTDVTEQVVNEIIHDCLSTTISTPIPDKTYLVFAESRGWFDSYGQPELGLKMECLGTRNARLIGDEFNGYLAVKRPVVQEVNSKSSDLKMNTSKFSLFGKKVFRNYVKNRSGKKGTA